MPGPRNLISGNGQPRLPRLTLHVAHIANGNDLHPLSPGLQPSPRRVFVAGADCNRSAGPRRGARSAGKRNGRDRVTALDDWNQLPAPDALAPLLACCGSREFADALVRARPFANADALLAAADNIWWSLG